MLAGCLAGLLNTNSPPGLVSVNEPDPAAWAPVWDRLQVLSNDLVNPPEPTFPDGPPLLQLELSPTLPQVAELNTAIQQARANRSQGRFHTLGEVLAVPLLSVDRAAVANGQPVHSPFLRLLAADPLWDLYQRVSLTDAAYEMIPAQLLERLREDISGRVAARDGRLHLQFTVRSGAGAGRQAHPASF